MTHLYWTQEPNERPDSASVALLAPGLSAEDRADLAHKLRLIFNGLGYVINPEELPRDPLFQDTLGRNRYIPVVDLPDIYLERVADQWRYSRHSVKAIPRLYRSVSPFGILEAVDELPAAFHKRYAGLRVWQYLFILLMLLVAIGTRLLMVPLLRFVLQRMVDRLQTHNIKLEAEPALRVVRPLSLVIILMLLRFFEPALQLPAHWNEWIMLIFRVAIPIMGVVAVYRVVDLLGHVGMKIAERTETTHDDQLVPILRTVGHVAVILTGTLYVLDTLDFNVTALLAGLSIGGIALALAAQDTVKNFFGSVMIFLDRPFRVGDFISTKGVEGTVESIGLRATRLRSLRNSVVYVPNSQLTDSTVDNLGLRVFRRYDTQLGLQYDTPQHLLEAFVEGIRGLLLQHPRAKQDNFQVVFHSFAESSLNVFLLVYFQVPTFTEELKARQELNLAILGLARQLGVSFAFPTRTLHLETQPGHLPIRLPYAHTSESAQAAASAHIASQASRWQKSWGTPETTAPDEAPH
jgi:MscS family membrane protein